MTAEKHGDTATLAEDLLRGVPKIANYIGESVRRTYYLLNEGYIPAGKEGAFWVAQKSRLRAHYSSITSGRAA
jgi:hypothetical protein